MAMGDANASLRAEGEFWCCGLPFPIFHSHPTLPSVSRVCAASSEEQACHFFERKKRMKTPSGKV